MTPFRLSTKPPPANLVRTVRERHGLTQVQCAYIVGCGSDDSAKLETARYRAADIQRKASEQFGRPECGWQWLDHNGHPA